MVNFKLFGDDLIILPRLSSNNGFSEVMADALSYRPDVDTHLNAPEDQTAKCSAFIEIVTLLDD